MYTLNKYNYLVIKNMNFGLQYALAILLHV
jgi:hypothetical protein